MRTKSELDIIDRTRGKVLADKSLTGENMFLIWGYSTVFFLLLEFVALEIWDAVWCQFLWVGIPLVGTPLMICSFHKDHKQTHHTEINEYIIMKMWIYIGCTACMMGFAMGFAGVYEKCFFALLCLLCSMGCLMTGIFIPFRAKTICGIISSVLSVLPLFFQGEWWHWQLLVTTVVITIALIIPGHLFRYHVKHNDL